MLIRLSRILSLLSPLLAAGRAQGLILALSPLLAAGALAQSGAAAPAPTPVPAAAPAPAAPPAPPAPAGAAPRDPWAVPVFILADKPAVVRPQPFNANANDIAVGPEGKNAWLRPEALYAVLGTGVAGTRFRLPSGGSEIDIRVGSQSKVSAGQILLGTGCALSVMGLVVAAGTAFASAVDDHSCELNGSCSKPPHGLSLSSAYGQGVLASGLVAGIGLGLCVTGGVLLGTGMTRIHIRQSTSRLAHVGSGGVWLTPGGLVF